MAIYTTYSNGNTPVIRYFYKDHLGSIDTVTDGAGVIKERLSYDPWGKRRYPNGTDDTATLQTAALAMGLNQALPVVQRLGATLGLDDLSVQATPTDAGALMAGKYLSPQLYIRYSYGLFNRIGGLLLRFKFSERLSVETRSGDQKSMDLLYTVEKD